MPNFHQHCCEFSAFFVPVLQRQMHSLCTVQNTFSVCGSYLCTHCSNRRYATFMHSASPASCVYCLSWTLCLLPIVSVWGPEVRPELPQSSLLCSSGRAAALLPQGPRANEKKTCAKDHLQWKNKSCKRFRRILLHRDWCPAALSISDRCFLCLSFGQHGLPWAFYARTLHTSVICHFRLMQHFF